MKHILSLALAAMLTATAASAQYYPAKVGSVLKYTSQSELPEPTTHTVTVTADSIWQDSGNTYVRLESHTETGTLKTVPDSYSTAMSKTGDPQAPTVITLMSPEQMRELMVNTIQNELASAVQMISPSDLEQIMAQIRPSGKLQLTIDPTAEPETKIPAASIRVNVATMNVSIHISGGKVLGQEQITTPAGTFDCIKISYIMKTNMAADSLKLYYTAWYAPGIGMVKEQGCDKKGKIVEQEELVQMLRP